MCQEKEDVVTYRATKFITVIYADAAGASAEITIWSLRRLCHQQNAELKQMRISMYYLASQITLKYMIMKRFMLMVEAEINFRKDDPLMWWKNRFQSFQGFQGSIWRSQHLQLLQ